MTELAPPFLRVPLRRAPRKDAVLEPRPPKGVGLSALDAIKSCVCTGALLREVESDEDD